ncbi:MAG: helix-turn-helix domain-containing protein, partial [Actinobacteria bacterium]|nr:helix-turn-helix domain-containing protein [Actinomycetota bacterium]
GAALYWVYVQPWDGWERTRRHEWARLGIEWLADNFKGWLPTYVPPGLSAPDPADQKRRLIVVLRCQRGLSYSEIAKIVGCHRSYVGKVLAALKGH